MNYLLDRKNFSLLLMDKLNFPKDSKETFNNILNNIINSPNASYEFKGLLNRYDNERSTPFNTLLSDAKSLGEKLNVHEYSIYMVLFLCMAKRLKEYYNEAKLPEKLCFDILADLSYKLNECRMVYGINGTFVAEWYKKIFNLEIFALGRLQFEPFTTKYECTFNGKVYPVGSKVINMHIPRTGTPLNHDEVLASYKMAEEMFAKEFPNGTILFYCDSWLLDPFIPLVLNPNSNLTAFHKDFTIVKTGESYNYSALWSVFDRIYDGDISKLPADTSLRRAYIERIKENKPFFYGHGMFFYKNGKILK